MDNQDLHDQFAGIPLNKGRHIWPSPNMDDNEYDKAEAEKELEAEEEV